MFFFNVMSVFPSNLYIRDSNTALISHEDTRLASDTHYAWHIKSVYRLHDLNLVEHEPILKVY